MASVDDQLAALATLSPAQLRAQWEALTRTPVPKISADLLRLALAWEIQAAAYGGLSRRTQKTLDQLARARTRTFPPHSGMRLVRAWNGQTHVVEIGEDEAIRWNGREWRSLSEVAREITGTRWSGPAFFGLKRRIAA